MFVDRSVRPRSVEHSQEKDISCGSASRYPGRRAQAPAPAQAQLLSRMACDPWFISLAGELRRDLLSAGDSLALQCGQVLCWRGDKPRGFYGVIEGCLKVSTMCEDGRETVLGLLEAGNWFGEVSMVEDSAHVHDVTAIGPSALIVVPPPAFNELMRRPAFAQAITLLLAGRVHRLYGAIEDAMLRSVRAQVARRLLHLAQGDAVAAGARRERTTVPVSHEVLATMLGITRQTLAKELRVLAAAGCIVQQYGRITITSMVTLQEFAARE